VTETNVFQLTQPGTFSDPLTEVLRNGARALLGQAVEAEVAALLSSHADKLTDDGRKRHLCLEGRCVHPARQNY
jgi:putative transposase